MSYIIAKHQSATEEKGVSHKKIIISLAKIVIKSVTFCKLEVV